jgi:Domain of unknown function (DUF222)
MGEGAVGSAAREARRVLVRAQAAAAEAALAYAVERRCREGADPGFGRDSAGVLRVRAGEFAADELAVMWCDDPWRVRRLLARCARVRSGLPAVWEAHRRGEVDADQLLVIDRAARRATQDATRVQIDTRVVEAARSRNPQQLASWLVRLVVECEPLAFAERHRRALAQRRVTISQGPDGMGWVTGELSATDVARIDTLLTGLARSLGPGDERTEQQRRADLMADLLLGRLHLDDHDSDAPETDDADAHTAQAETPTDTVTWVEVEDVDLHTGELLGTRLAPVTPDGEPLDPADLTSPAPSDPSAATSWLGVRAVWRPQTIRIGVVVPLSSLLGLSDTPGQLADRSGAVPADTLRQSIADALGSDAGSQGDEVLFTRLLTDDGGRLLDTTELGRHPSRRLAEAVALRAGTCRFPTCTVPADQCDLDHRDPWPHGQTSANGLDPGCRRHHRAKTFAWLAPVRDRDAVDWTLPDDHTYRRTDDPLPTGITTGTPADHARPCSLTAPWANHRRLLGVSRR